ncbi:CinA family protein [Actinotalea ferrariae]|uniref:CinA family protein n=1 Tax=Actinotalea ferrariae TaxID=1386098 RepID=UPI001C8BE635|nr:CinA family protein [Actinotalea ferrariae]MBX9243476.1 CinA family protein [Actinotalea ferrariae]
MSNLSTAVETTAAAAEDLTDGLAEALGQRGWTVATAESLTAGTIGTVLAAAPQATAWFRGTIACYSPEVKFGLLGVPRGPVVTEECAAILARETARLLDADLVVSCTGVGGPDPDEGEPAGTVWFAVASPGGEHTEKQVFAGSPPEVLVATTKHAVELLRRAVTGAL